MAQKTIFACSSGQGRAGIAVWRVSGPDAAHILKSIAGVMPAPRYAGYRKFRDLQGEIIDDGLVLWFPGPNSVTGEDLAEFHTHGSEAVRHCFIKLFTDVGAHPAAPGEFTMRAFEHGRMDLLAVEALGDLLEAETEAQRQQALAIGSGAATNILRNWRDDLISALAVLEAGVDFPDEEDVPFDIAHRALPLLAKVRTEMHGHLQQDGRKIRDGVTLAIIGAPNAGKSSFLNRLLGEDRAIVSEVAGTTRDTVSERFILGDRLVRVVDTAGLRANTEDPIEKLGMERSRREADKADIVLWIRESGSSPETLDLEVSGHLVVVDNKIDLAPAVSRETWPISVKTGEGWDALLAHLKELVEQTAPSSLFPHERQRALIEAGERVLDQATDMANAHRPTELLADDVRQCLDALDQLDGRRTTEAVLGQVFSCFCIGK